MAKNRVKRSLQAVAASQNITEEKHADKFEAIKDLATGQAPVKSSTAGRISPQISCTVDPADKQLLNELTLYASNKLGRVVNTSTVIRALIRLGSVRREELEF
ncbi:hypothetical protein [Estrella lausannensis]|uniref:Uncharacterized protein n=1 Tax=Estrella lausannensis TaxID=483423 RepID=A0A0H5DSC9_9BACT|nr:hypothetical protein [Estrella lausannensis]CRX39592.1 hypothetical protein ELAC_p0015 [Estrella lausannensis]